MDPGSVVSAFLMRSSECRAPNVQASSSLSVRTGFFFEFWFERHSLAYCRCGGIIEGS